MSGGWVKLRAAGGAFKRRSDSGESWMDMNRESLLKKLSGILKDGIHVVDAGGITILYNRKMSVIENRSEEDMVGKSIYDLTETPGSRAMIHSLQTGMPQVNLIYSNVNKFGNQVITNCSIWPVNENGVNMGAVKFAVDITEIRALRNKVLGITKDINEIVKKEQQKKKENNYMISDLIGESAQMERVKQMAILASRCDSNVMIVGGSGTGKELIAQGIHNESGRRDKPLIAENCAAIPENLLESTFFGTVKGGFTGAVDRPGLFQLAHGGTLILDEINSLPVGLQAKLLRALQEGEFRPVGGSKTVAVDVRVVAITNEDPEQLISRGILRLDLFYRLSVVDIFVPDLVERGRDLEILASYFLRQFCQDSGKDLLGFSPQVKQAFHRDRWKGNVRELRNVIQCGVSLTGRGQMIELAGLPYYFAKRHKGKPPERAETIQAAGNAGREAVVNLTEYMGNLEYSLIKNALERNGGNVSKAAENLGITRQALQYKLRKLEL